MDLINSHILTQLNKRTEEHSLRTLRVESGLSDFASNDYLGFSRSHELKKLFMKELASYPDFRMGSGGSRLLSGNDEFIEDFEARLAVLLKAESALFYNSGYDANVGFFASLPTRGDTIITDELIHASVIDGARLSYANRFTFKHNDLESLEQKLRIATGRIYVAVESLYSMDGDFAPLKEICEIAAKYDAAVIVDEAHAGGIFGSNGCGLVEELHLTDLVFARLFTFGKAMGTHGAVIVGNKNLKSFLINFSRSFIYTTASPFTAHLAAKVAIEYLQTTDHQSDLFHKINIFRSLSSTLDLTSSPSSPIQIISAAGNEKARLIARACQSGGFDVRAILSPTVKAGSERIRVCIHNHNSEEEIKKLCELLKNLKKAHG